LGRPCTTTSARKKVFPIAIAELSAVDKIAGQTIEFLFGDDTHPLEDGLEEGERVAAIAVFEEAPFNIASASVEMLHDSGERLDIPGQRVHALRERVHPLGQHVYPLRERVHPLSERVHALGQCVQMLLGASLRGGELLNTLLCALLGPGERLYALFGAPLSRDERAQFGLCLLLGLGEVLQRGPDGIDARLAGYGSWPWHRGTHSLTRRFVEPMDCPHHCAPGQTGRSHIQRPRTGS
jgi:hypothetical protein